MNNCANMFDIILSASFSTWLGLPSIPTAALSRTTFVAPRTSSSITGEMPSAIVYSIGNLIFELGFIIDGTFYLSLPSLLTCTDLTMS